MDPNTALAELRRIVGRLLDTGYGDTVPDGWYEDALAALEHVAAIDEFLTSGGFLPTEWAPATT